MTSLVGGGVSWMSLKNLENVFHFRLMINSPAAAVHAPLA